MIVKKERKQGNLMFKITKIEKGELKEGHSKNSSWFELSVEFFNDDKDVHFGTLGKYFNALVMFDKKKYEEHYDNMPNDDMYFEKIQGSQLSQIKFKSKSPYELGYCKNMECQGTDCIQELGDNKFKYSCFVSFNYITEACVKQIEEMKEHQEKDYCRYGDYPEQVGAFRSGVAFHDFVGILETLDRFWD
jgi:hypothetical protein